MQYILSRDSGLKAIIVVYRPARCERDGVSKVKEKILEIAEIAKACPENLQTICFELLLKDYLSSRASEREGKSGSAEPAKSTPEPTTEEQEPAVTTEGLGKGQDDLSGSDLHVKARHFLKKHDLKLSQLNNLFYKENGQILPLYDDLRPLVSPKAKCELPCFKRCEKP